ncbi:MAG: glycosyltransferase family 2 protein, partial [Myxococcota bacterium]
MGENSQALPADEFRSRTFVVVPAFNEASSVGRVVRELTLVWPRVVVVDDGSSDGTANEARRAGATCLRHVINRGQGAALQTGITHSLRAGADCIVTFDADGQHEVCEIPQLVEPVLRGDCDVALGSRFLGSTEYLPRGRWIILKAGVLFSRLMSGLPVTDTHNGFRAFSRRAASAVSIQRDGMAHASEILDQIARLGFRYVEVPVRVRYTRYSRSKAKGPLHAIKV